MASTGVATTGAAAGQGLLDEDLCRRGLVCIRTFIYKYFIDKAPLSKLSSLGPPNVQNLSVQMDGGPFDRPCYIDLDCPNADNSEFSNTTTLSYTTDTILSGLGLGPRSLWGCSAPPPFWQDSSPPRLTRPLALQGLLLLLTHALSLMVRPYADNSELSYSTTLSYTTDTRKSAPPRLNCLQPMVSFYCIRPAS